MGLFDNFLGSASKASASTFGNGSEIDRETVKIYETAELISGSDATGTILENWYKQKPYAFRFRDITFYLPISPSNLSITTHFGTNIISTMYGTIEEHSEQRYYDIQISGTTGMSPRYYKNVGDQVYDSIDTKSIGRASTPIASRVGGTLGGFFKRTQSLIENTLNQVSDLLGEDNGSTGIDLQRTGYAAFHNFYKFLLLHKKVATGQSNAGSGSRSLTFINYKDNNQYNVAIQTFQLVRDVSNPMLYNYSITMRAYNLRSADSKDIELDVKDRLAELGLDGLETTSIATKLANKARQAKNAAYSAVAAAKGFGS
jgi:hypothetical protein